jgi:hypothetical protein
MFSLLYLKRGGNAKKLFRFIRVRREEQEKSRRNSICGTGTGNLCEFGPHGHYTYHIHTIHPVIHESTVSCGKEPVSVLFCTADRRDTACKRVSGSSSVL